MKKIIPLVIVAILVVAVICSVAYVSLNGNDSPTYVHDPEKVAEIVANNEYEIIRVTSVEDFDLSKEAYYLIEADYNGTKEFYQTLKHVIQMGIPVISFSGSDVFKEESMNMYYAYSESPFTGYYSYPNVKKVECKDVTTLSDSESVSMLCDWANECMKNTTEYYNSQTKS